MRILMTTDTVGGVWNFTCTLTEQLLERGHEVHLVSFGRAPSPEQESWASQLARGARASHVVISAGAQRSAEIRSSALQPGPAFTYTATTTPLEWMPDNGSAFTDGARTLTETAATFRPDILLSNQFCFGALPIGCPCIVVAHSDVLSWAQACRGAAFEPSPWLDRYTHLVSTGLQHATAVVAPTFTMAKALVDHFPAPHGVEVIPNGAAVEPAVAPSPPRKLQAITAGRLWDEAKGLGTLAQLTATPIPLLVAGDNSIDPTSTHPAWPAHLANLGPLSQTQLHDLFRALAIYLCTSLYEPFGLAPLEAALCGCALVLRDIPSLREVWGDAALYFTDLESLRTLLHRLAGNSSLLANAQRSAHTRATDYTPERMTDSYLDLFTSVLRKQQPPREAHVA